MHVVYRVELWEIILAICVVCLLLWAVFAMFRDRSGSNSTDSATSKPKKENMPKQPSGGISINIGNANTNSKSEDGED